MKPIIRLAIVLVIGVLSLWVVHVHAQGSGDSNDEGYSYIAFHSNGIQIMDDRTRTVIRLTEPTGWFGMPLWSPDGQRIAFDASLSDRHDTRDIIVLDIDGSRAVEITRTTLPSTCERAAWKWTPDGNYLALSCPVSNGMRSSYTIVHVSTDNPTEIDTLTLAEDVSCPWFDFSKDGLQIVCGSSNRDESTHYFTILDGQSGEVILDHTRASRTAETIIDLYTLDENRFLVGYFPPSQIDVFDFQGETLYASPSGLFDDIGELVAISPSPDGSQLVYGAANFRLAALHLETEHVTIIYTSENGEQLYLPSWSPLLDEPLDLPDEPYTVDDLCRLLEESGSGCAPEPLGQ